MFDAYVRWAAIVSAVFLAACILACGGGPGPAPPVESPAPDTGQSEPPSSPVLTPRQRMQESDLAVSDARALLQDYDANEIRGDQKYKDGWLAVRGRIQDVNKDILGGPFVTLDCGSDTLFCVQCFFPRAEESSLVSLSPGQTIVIGGRCDGKFGNVMLKECFFYAPPQTAMPEKPAITGSPPPDPPPRRSISTRSEAELRTWTDATGKYQVEARFVSATMGQVKLRKVDGSEVVLSMERLSEADQEWLRQRASR